MSAQVFSIVLGAIFITTSAVNAQTTAVPRLDLESQFYEELAKEAGEDVPTTKGLFDEVPTGLSTKDMSPDCDPRRFEDSIVGKKLSTAQYFAATKQYFNK